jgi:peptidylprolyl isomerase
MTAKQGDSVRVHYTGKLYDGTVLDSSLDREPLELTIGEGLVIPGFEEAIVGMSVGEVRNVEIPADRAFGPYVDTKVLNLERGKLPPDTVLYLGQWFHLHRDGEVVPMVVTKITKDHVVLDGNHPLAGKNLVFEIELLDIGVTV